MQTLRANDLHAVRDLAPDIVILEIGSNDLLKLPLEIWCVCLSAIFQFARSASVMSSHVTFSFRMLCRFGVTQRF